MGKADTPAYNPYGLSFLQPWGKEGMDAMGTLGEAKGITCSSWWQLNGEYNASGSTDTTVIMADAYNSSGSPYRALKTYLMLVLKEDHLFSLLRRGSNPNLIRHTIQQFPLFFPY
jgi:hypothetical protein